MTSARKGEKKNVPLALTVNDHIQKNGDFLGLWDNTMDFEASRVPFYGIYWKGMRYLSDMVILLDGTPLLPLFSSTLCLDGHIPSPFFRHIRLLGPSISNLMDNTSQPSIVVDGPLLIDRGRFCFPEGMVEELTVHNHGPLPIRVPISIMLKADFLDIMDVRGIRNPPPNHLVSTLFSPLINTLTLSCLGLDHVERTTRAMVTNLDVDWKEGILSGELKLLPHQARTFRLHIVCDEKTEISRKGRRVRALKVPRSISHLLTKDERDKAKFRGMWPRITSSGLPIERWTENAINDLRILLTPTRHGPFPYAGIPWFSTPFGRDALITGYSTLWAFPSLTRSVLLFLAATQAEMDDPFRDAEKGKILHEFRYGEAGSASMIPFGRYYGSIDSTPLFVALSWEYFRRTGDFRTIFRLRKSLFQAMEWIEKKGVDPSSGFLVYSGDHGKGLVQKGWKDSGDSVFHANGELATDPIALSEVQGYLYMAYLGYSQLSSLFGDHLRVRIFEKKAQILKERFNKSFWSEKIRMFALAIDGTGKRCEVRTSNAGHLLFSGIAEEKYARTTARELLKSDMFSGWGIRTLGTREVRYNPVSYHNGSIWPHDNAMILAGFSRYDLGEELSVLAGAYFNTLSFLPSERPPELYCGFEKGSGTEGPLSYPTSCRIQAWSVASLFLAIQSIAAMDFDTSPRHDINHFAGEIPSIGSLKIENISNQSKININNEIRGFFTREL